jgi:hemoglobin-like flavoprotein
LVPQPKTAPSPLAEMPTQTLDRLATLRLFFAAMEPRLSAIVVRTYGKMFEAEPGMVRLFKGDIRAQQLSFLAKLKSIVQLTRSSQLWPVGTPAGQMLIPQVAEFGRNHAKLGVTPAHFALMKKMMIAACKENAPESFTPAVEEALSFIFDVLAQSLTAGDSTTDVLSKLRLCRNEAVLHDPAAYFDEETSAATV